MLDSYKIIQITRREDVQRLKFLLEAVSPDNDRPVLQSIFVDAEKSRAVSADGFRLHMCQIPECLQEYPNHLVRFTQAPKIGMVIVEIQESGAKDRFGLTNKFPDYDVVIKLAENNPAFYEISADSGLLVGTLHKLPSKYFRITFHGFNQPFRIEATSNLTDAAAIIMPVHADSNRPLTEVANWFDKYTTELHKREELEARDLNIRALALIEAGRKTHKSLYEQTEKLQEQVTTLRKEIIRLENTLSDLKKEEAKKLQESESHA